MEDEKLDELLRDVRVPENLKASLLGIPDQGDVCVANIPLRRKLWTAVGVAASIAALVLVLLNVPRVDVAVIENQDDEASSLLLADMRQNLESMDLLQRIYELEQGERRIKRAEPLLTVDESVSLALTIPWKSSLDRGASIATVRPELEYVINHFPGTSGAREAEAILQLND